jgi:nucleotide-binding universal stress UspA family protein
MPSDFDWITAKPALLAYDGSESSATAIAVAERLVSGRLALVCHVPHGDERTADQVVADGVQLARTAGLDATPMVEREQRKVWRALLAAADRHGASLIVVGAQGLSGLGRAILGSVSTALVHSSPIPVLVVPGTTTMDRTNGPLLLCYDGSEGARHAIAVASRELRGQPASVLHIWESWVAEVPALAGVSATVQGVAAELDEVADEQSADHTVEGVQVAEQAGFDAEGLSERATGPTWKAVLDIADQHGCAAIVVGSRGLTGFSAALGSVSNGVIHHSRRPVLVVPPEER